MGLSSLALVLVLASASGCEKLRSLGNRAVAANGPEQEAARVDPADKAVPAIVRGLEQSSVTYSMNPAKSMDMIHAAEAAAAAAGRAGAQKQAAMDESDEAK